MRHLFFWGAAVAILVGPQIGCGDSPDTPSSHSNPDPSSSSNPAPGSPADSETSTQANSSDENTPMVPSSMPSEVINESQGDATDNDSEMSEVSSTDVDVESAWLVIPFDDPTDPRTISAVMGLRRVNALDPERVELIFGPSFSQSDAEDNPEGFNIYSPDDENYAYDLFVEPTMLTHVPFDDVAEAPEDRFGRLRGHTVTLTLPHALTMGSQYFFRAIGGSRTTLNPDQHHKTSWEGYPITAGRTATHLSFGESTSPNDAITEELIGQVMGLRTIERVSPTIIRLVLGGGTVSEALDMPTNFEISSSDDERYLDGHLPTEVGRRTFPELFAPNYGYPFTRRFDRSEVYLVLPHALAEGMTYTVTLGESVTTGRRRMTMTYENNAVYNPHLKINQEGYHPESPVKAAYLGAWMGTLGSLSLDEFSPECELVNADNGEQVWSGDFQFRRGAEVADEGPLRQANLTHENLYVCDFSSWTTPGRYYIRVPQMGRSYEFDIAADVYLKAFRVSMRGLLYQRAGLALDQPLSLYRKPATHNEPIEIPYMDNKPIIGGHYDAGDYNPRAHYEVAHLLLLIYELYPDKFADAQVGVPEAGNGIPDILDEAAWAIRPFMALQDADGGVGGRDDGISIESHSDPNFVMTPERDPYLQETYAKHPRASFTLAALGAAAARCWRLSGADEEATRYLAAARRAYDWAMENGADQVPVFQAWAAAELAHTTGAPEFTESFRNSGFSLGDPLEDGGAERMRPIIAYAINTHAMADPILRETMISGIQNIADVFGATSERFAYPHFQHPWAPVSWGTGAYPHRIEPAVLAYTLTGDETYLRWMLWSADFALGVNPLNRSWITGLGDRPIYGPTHLWGWNTYQGVIPPGLQTEGPYQNADDVSRWNPEGVPPPAETPAYYNYQDVRYHIGLNEGIVTNMAWTTFLFAALLP